jgi:hypothetical protein
MMLIKHLNKILSVALVSIFSWSGFGQNESLKPNLNPDLEVYLSVEFSEGLVVSESLTAYQLKEGLYVPARQLSESLGLNFKVNESGEIAGDSPLSER